jgi:hypothetical protein
MRDSVEANRSPRWGIWHDGPADDAERVFHAGFFARTMIQLLDEIRGHDRDLEARAFHVVWGLVDWNQNHAQYASSFWSSGTASGSVESSGQSTTMADPAGWFGLHTGRMEYVDLMLEYVDRGLHGGREAYGPSPEGDLKERWSGDWLGRVVDYTKRHRRDPAPPAAIADLAATWEDGEVVLAWTTPAGADRFHVVWSTKPISGTWTSDDALRNPWACTPVGTGLRPAWNERQELRFRGVPAGGPVHVAVYTFSQTDDMSGISNVARVDVP